MAFYNLRCRWIAANLKYASFGLDLETPVSLTAAELQDIVDAATTEWLTNVNLFCTDMQLAPCTIQGQERVANTPPQPAGWHREPTTTLYTGAGAPADGTVTGQSVPPQNSLVVTLRTASPGRRALGRVYTPPPPESVVIGTGQVSDFAARATMVQDVVTAAEGAIAPVDVDHVVWSVTYDEQAEVTQYIANEIMDTQRRRASR